MRRRISQGRSPRVPYSPGDFNSQLETLPLNQSTPENSPLRRHTPVITPNPYAASPQLEWDNLQEAFIGDSLRGVEEELGGVYKLGSNTDHNFLDNAKVPIVSTDVSSLDSSIPEVFSIMGSEELRKELGKIKIALQDVNDSITDFDVNDVDVYRISVVERDLEKIWDQVKDFRWLVRNLKEKFADSLSTVEAKKLDDQVAKLLTDAKNHARSIRKKVHDIAPPKPLSEFEQRSLEAQKKTSDMLELALKEQQKVQTDAANSRKTEALATLKVSYEKVLEDCSQLVMDVQATDDQDSWETVNDEGIKKAMHSKSDWSQRIKSINEDFHKYKTLASTWQPESLDNEESDFSQLKDQVELAKSAVEETLDAIDKEDSSRSLFTLDRNVTSKLDYPTFSGKYSECFIKFKQKMERALRANKVPKVDQVDKLREHLSGFALLLVPDSTRD